MRKYQDHKATVGEGDDERESVVSARVSDGDETVNTTAGPRSVNKGDIVIKTDNPNVFDVLDAKTWSETGYASSTPAPEPSVRDGFLTKNTGSK